MSKLTDELQYILNWLKSTNHDFFDCYNPGLTRQQIDEITKDLPFRLSEEVYELYQWRNGTADLGYNNGYLPLYFLFPEQLRADVICSFCSLQDSVYIYKTIREATSDEYWNQKWFPIAEYESRKMLYVVGDLDPSPVYLWDVGCLEDSVIIYKNLISMISVIAECCEFGLYQLIPDEDGEEDDMIIRIDEEKLELEKEIYRKYNS
ncbi:MAG: SMI1/KNR4 family protein [Nostoc sp.]|uniref:SMI1/KNR4 family protein n=1 Tax=Nostoc sp. TaxID=1180 RepID=UPI002FFAB149